MYVCMCVCIHNKNTYENAPDNYRLAINNFASQILNVCNIFFTAFIAIYSSPKENTEQHTLPRPIN